MLVLVFVRVLDISKSWCTPRHRQESMQLMLRSS